MKIAQLVRPKQHKLSPLKARVLQYLQGHPDEVFPYRDEALARELDMKVSAVSFTLWALHGEGLIARETVAGKIYFGSRQAIERLRRRLGKQPAAEASPDPLERASALQERIRRRIGNVDVLAWLDESRQRAD